MVRGPDETRKDGNICPVCKRRLTEGVLYRVQELSDERLIRNVGTKISPNGIKWYTDVTKIHPPFVKLVPLLEIVAEALSSTSSSQKVRSVYFNLCEELGSEIQVLLKTPIAKLEKLAGPKVAQGIDKVRRGDIVIDPGFDGEYGKVKIWNHELKAKVPEVEEKSQLGLQF